MQDTNENTVKGVISVYGVAVGAPTYELHYMVDYWSTVENMVEAGDDLPDTVDTTTSQDSTAAFEFKIGSLDPGASVTVSFISAIGDDINDLESELIDGFETTAPPVQVPEFQSILPIILALAAILAITRRL